VYKKLIHVFTGVVKDDEGKILFVNRKEEELPNADGKWEIPGGKVDFGEKPEESLEREIFEETGYKVNAFKLLPKTWTSRWQYPDFEQHTVIMCFECKLLSKDQVIQDDHHVNEIRWIKKEELENYDCLPGVKEFVNLTN